MLTCGWSSAPDFQVFCRRFRYGLSVCSFVTCYVEVFQGNYTLILLFVALKQMRHKKAKG